MRIAHFTNTYHPVVSGVVRSVSSFRQGLTELGHTVFVFSQYASHYTDVEPYVFRYPAFELPVYNNFPVTIPVSPFVDWLLPPLKLDVIHAHHPFLLGQTAANKAEELKLPFVFTFHTRYRDYSHYLSLNQAMVKEVIDRWLGVFMQQCHHIVVPSDSIRRMLVDLYGVQAGVSVIPTGLEMAPYTRADGAAVRQREGWGEDRVLISVGRLAPEKNWHLLLEAAIPVMRRRPGTRLVILGDGDERDSLKKAARQAGLAERIHLPGSVPFDEVPAYLKAADVFCFASVTETQGLVTLEAMAAGLPVAAVAATGTADVVTDGEEGLLTTEEPGGLGQAIERLLDDDSLRRELGQQALARAENFDLKRQASALLQAYDEATAAWGAGRTIQVDRQKPLLAGKKWYELLGFERNPLRALLINLPGQPEKN